MKWREDPSPRNNPARLLAVALSVIAGLALLTLGGCRLPAAIYTTIRYPVGIEFIDAKSGQSHFVASEGLSREWIAGIGADHESCLTLQREGKAIIARIRALDGQVRSERRLPLLTGPHPAFYEDEFTITQDLDRVAFYDYSTKAIVLYDGLTGRQRDLFPNAGSNGAGIAYLRFLKSNQLLLILNSDRNLARDSGDVLLIDTDTGSTTSLLKEDQSFRTTHSVAVSRSNRLAVITDSPPSPSLRQTIRIFDLDRRQQVASIGDPDAFYIAWTCLSPGSQMIGWIRHTKDGKAIMISPQSGARPRQVRAYPRDTRCTYLAFLDEQTLVLQTSTKDEPTKRLVAVNILSGEERFYSEKAFWGKVLVAGERPVIICEMGY